MSLANVYRVQVETMVLDVPCTINLHYRYGSGVQGGHPALDLAAIFWTTMGAPLRALLATTVQVMRVIVHPLAPTYGNPYEANYDSTVVGTGGSADPLPPSVAMLIKLQCDSDNARNNGHIYIAGCPEARWDGFWEAAWVTAAVEPLMALLLANLPVSPDGVVYIPCVVSRVEDGVLRDPPITFDVINVQLAAPISQQRRRQSGKQGIKS